MAITKIFHCGLCQINNLESPKNEVQTIDVSVRESHVYEKEMNMVRS